MNAMSPDTGRHRARGSRWLQHGRYRLTDSTLRDGSPRRRAPVHAGAGRRDRRRARSRRRAGHRDQPRRRPRRLVLQLRLLEGRRARADPGGGQGRAATRRSPSLLLPGIGLADDLQEVHELGVSGGAHRHALHRGRHRDPAHRGRRKRSRHGGRGLPDDGPHDRARAARSSRRCIMEDAGAETASTSSTPRAR